MYVDIVILLQVTHTVWMREHNRVAGRLQDLNPAWSDEKLYQEARRVVIAELQHITYTEWLPIILGPSYMDNNNMSPRPAGYSRKYNKDVNPGITNVFATAAFRCQGLQPPMITMSQCPVKHRLQVWPGTVQCPGTHSSPSLSPGSATA